MADRVLTCVYCGHEYPQNTPAWDNEVLTEHIKVCAKHPMSRLRADNDKLRKALVGLIGVATKEELEEAEARARRVRQFEVAGAAVLDCIRALLATLPDAEAQDAP